MAEFVDLLDDNGQIVGIIDRNEAHKNGCWHKTIHTWVVNSKGELLLAKRSKFKSFYPSCWDCSFAGHVGVDESEIDSAIREGNEEIGLKLLPEDFIHICTYKDFLSNGDQTCNQFAEVYVVEKDVDITLLKNAADEVDEIKWVNGEVFLKDIFKKQGNYLFHGVEEYRALEKFLTNKYKTIYNKNI